MEGMQADSNYVYFNAILALQTGTFSLTISVVSAIG